MITTYERKGVINIDFSIWTLITVLILVMGTQVIALFLQYKLSNTYKGIGYWLSGTAVMMSSFIFMSLIYMKDFSYLAILGNPLLIISHVFLYIGTKEFLDKKIRKTYLTILVVAFTMIYCYFILINDNIGVRIFFITLTIASLSFMIVYQLLHEKKKVIANSVHFVAAVFFLYGLFHVFRLLQVCLNPVSTSSAYQSTILVISFMSSILMSNLWCFGFIVMINQRLHIDHKLEKEKFQSIFNTNPDAQIISSFNDGKIVDVNSGFSFLSGYSKEEVIGIRVQSINFWNSLDDRKDFFKSLNGKGSCKNKEFTFKRKDRSVFYGMISSSILTIHSVDYITSVVRDITERKEFEAALIESEEKYRSILKASPDDITITDLAGNIQLISPAANKMFGYAPEFDGFIGMQLFEFIVPEDKDRARRHISEMYQGGNENSNEYRGIRQDKSIFDIEVNSGFAYDANGQPTKMVFIVRDITERKDNERQIQDLIRQLKIDKNRAQLNSITDSLTGLVNRGCFDTTLESEFSRLKESGLALSLIMLDIDYFKKYNDNYGHLAGDGCLKKIATILKSIIRSGPDIVARYGGEEFIVILPETDEKGAKILGERLRHAIEDLKIPHGYSDVSKYVTTSLGVVTVYPTESIIPEQVLKLVDEALYSAKETGRNKCVYSSNAKYLNVRE